MRFRFPSIVYFSMLAACSNNKPRQVSDTSIVRDTNKKESVVVNKNTQATTSTTLDRVEDSVISAVLNLPEMIAFSHLVDSVNHGQRKVMSDIFSSPTKDSNYYWVRVGEDNGDMFVVEYHFFVYPPKMLIKYYDVADDTVISLGEWRKRRKQGNSL
jgi:hypothetical protein